MYDLITLGGIDLQRTESSAPHPLLGQRKRFALLAYLALARPRGIHRRSMLLGLLWPELGAEHGRSALRQAVHGLRRSLGEKVIRSRGDEEIWLDGSVLSCDAVRFEEALGTGQLTHAVELYQGPLLPGFYVDGASGFERWLEDERSRLRERAVSAAWRLAGNAEVGGDLPAAVGWARLGVHHSEHDESSYRRLMAILARSGDRAGAIAAYLQLSRRLAHDFDCAPSAETDSLLRAIKSKTASSLVTPPRPHSVTLQ